VALLSGGLLLATATTVRAQNPIPGPPPELLPRTFWVAPYGDANQTWQYCSPADPFLTLDQARAQIQAYRAAWPSYNTAHWITVKVSGGEYLLHETVVFTSDDSGWSTRPIRYVAWDPDGIQGVNDKDAFFSGGIRLSGCVIETSRLPFCNTTVNIWACPVPPEITDVRDVYLNRRRMLRARFPNVPEICPHTSWNSPTVPPCALEGFLPVRLVQDVGEPGVDPELFQRVILRRHSGVPAWPSVIDAIGFEIVGHPQYLSPRQQVDPAWVTLDQVTNELVIEFPIHEDQGIHLGGFGVYNHNNPASQPQHVRGEANVTGAPQLATVVVLEGALAFLDAHEEWHFTPPPDPQTPGTLRIALCAAHTDLDEEDLVVPVLEELLRFDEAAWVEFHGLDFAYTHFPFPTQADGTTPGYSSFHSGMQWTGGVEPPDILGGAILLLGSEGVRFTECRIAHTGATAVKITTKVLANPTEYRPSHFNTLHRCEIFDVGGKAVHIGDPYTRSNPWGNPPDPSRPHASRLNEIVQCKIYQYGLIYKDAPAITLFNVGDTYVAYNEVSFGNWAGMEIGGHGRSASLRSDWTAWGCTGPHATEGTRIEYNHIHRACLGLVDCGGIYMAGTHYSSVHSPYSTLVGNYITSMQPSPYLYHAGGVNGLYFDRGADRWFFAGNFVRNVQRLMHFNNQQPGNPQMEPPQYPTLPRIFGGQTWPTQWTQKCGAENSYHQWPGQFYYEDLQSDQMANRWFFPLPCGTGCCPPSNPPCPCHPNACAYYKRFSQASENFGSSALPTNLNQNVFLEMGVDAIATAIVNAAGPSDSAIWFPGTGERIYPLARLCARRCTTPSQPNPSDESDFDLWDWEWDW
jgi:hypothetical protein